MVDVPLAHHVKEAPFQIHLTRLERAHHAPGVDHRDAGGDAGDLVQVVTRDEHARHPGRRRRPVRREAAARPRGRARWSARRG